MNVGKHVLQEFLSSTVHNDMELIFYFKLETVKCIDVGCSGVLLPAFCFVLLKSLMTIMCPVLMQREQFQMCE
jgi:hypothetical protein